MRNASPLRYPGGKWRLARCFEGLVRLNYDQPPVYVEPYAGGASLALSLLFSTIVSEVYLNDLDPAIHAFWSSVLCHNDDFCRLVERVPVTPIEWRKQKEIYSRGLKAGRFALGFATFFLNRTNHSGILNGGMIGGKKQRGEWKVDARFNRVELVRRLQKVAEFKKHIHLRCKDAVDFLRQHKFADRTLIYLDPPYFQSGRDLYLNAYKPNDHALLRNHVVKLRCRWVVSYDDVPEIRKLYLKHVSRRVRLMHTARSAHVGKEVMFFSRTLKIPSAIQ
ncbi:MAG TPA: DNA adenine methylase [Candidatus Acidoferrales bacterium]|jgi:DNA adenine methylase|nr:DNA adenine methylase [Candidatus Acidoferrales bacterium]